MGDGPTKLIRMRKPEATDGAAIWELVRACKPLDENSMYCNLIQCDHFAETCVLAEMGGEIVGWISGYVRPDDPGTLFVWQVAVDKAARGTGLGSKMLKSLINRDACSDVTRLQTTITADNEGSWALFRRFAKNEGGLLDDAPHFEREDHFDGAHATEHMVTITLDEDALEAAA